MADVNYRTLGDTGTKVSELCFGTWRFAYEDDDGNVETDEETAHDLLDACWEHGINFIDTANVYGDPNGTSEEWIGDWLADYDRDDFVISSKVRFGMGDGPNDSGLSRRHIRNQIEDTLDRLGTDYLDLYYIHMWDEDTPIRETLSVLDDLVHEGKVHYLGASNVAAWQLTKALWESDVEGLQRFDVTQPRYNAAYRDSPADLLDVCADQDVAVCPYSPLEGGFLTGKYEREDDAVEAPDSARGERFDWGDRFEERQWETLAAVREVAAELDATPAQVALRWLIERDRFTCVPIVGARTVEQLDDDAGALSISLSDDQRERITEAY
ncbi:MAG: aldo/keto reductase [Halobacteriaceae archaeon]